MLRSQHTDSRIHTIVDFLSRPQLLFESSWGTDLKRNAKIFNDFKIPDLLLTKSMFAEKLKGFSSFRATAVITFQFQTQPFQCGRVLMASFPVPTLVPDRVTFALNHVSRAMLLNHVQCDIAKETEVVLKIPFVSPYNSFDLVSNKFSWSQISGMVYSPLSSVGNISVDVMVYGHFEDIQLGAPTSGYIAQAGESPPSFSDFRQRAKESGFTSGGVSRVGRVLNTVSGLIGEYIPFLKKGTDFLSDNVFGPIDTTIGPLLSLFGFSKPLLEIQPPTVLRPCNTLGTTDGNDLSHSLGLSDQTNVPYIKSLNGSGMDEMSFDYLKKIPQYISVFSYGKVAKGTILWQDPVKPHYWLPAADLNIDRKLQNVPVLNVYQPSHLAYITSPFKYWSGSLVYTFKFVKTDYHSGRVEFSFHPFSDYVEGKSMSDYCYRLIVDLRHKSEVSFTIPFISPTPYKRLGNPSGSKYSQVAHSSTGTLVCRALTELKASNAVVSNSIEVLVEVNAGEDFNVTCPIESLYKPFTPALGDTPSSFMLDEMVLDAQTDSTVSGEDVLNKVEASIDYVAEAGHSAAKQTNPQSESIYGDPDSITNQNPYNMDMSLVISGEKFNNFRNFMKRSNFVRRFAASGSSTLSTTTFDPQRFLHAPYLHLSIYPASGSGGAQLQPTLYLQDAQPSPLTFVSSMYALYRGGVRFKVYTPEDIKTTRALFRPQSIYGSPSVPNREYAYAPLAIEQAPIKGLSEFQVPYYSICLSSSFRSTEEKFYYSTPRNYLDISMSPACKEFYLAVSAGDDLDFNTFIGTPPVIPSTYQSDLVQTGTNKVHKLNSAKYEPYSEPPKDVSPTNTKIIRVADLL